MDTTTNLLPSPSDLHLIYNQIKTYPFSTDPEFQTGLRVILSTTPLHPSEIRTRTLQAQCFYISRKYNIIPLVGVDGYMNWLREMGEESGVLREEKEKGKEKEEAAKNGGGGGDDITLTKNITSPATITTTTAPAPAPAPAPASEPHGPVMNLLSSATTTEEPTPPLRYPQSFNHLIELITTGQPIPGIKEVPDTLLTGQGSKAVESKRTKPWEVHREQQQEIGGEKMDGIGR